MTAVIVNRYSDGMHDSGETAQSGGADLARAGDGQGPRDRMVRSAAALIARGGLRATGMREIADHAQAPRGSIRHHFPGGKDQLTIEAMAWIGESVRAELDHAAATTGERSTARSVIVLDRFVAMWRQGLAQTQVATGCSVAAVVHDSDDPALLAQAARVFASWREPFHRALLADGVTAGQASALATTVVGALEGAVILSRAQRDIEPLGETAGVLRHLLATAAAT